MNSFKVLVGKVPKVSRFSMVFLQLKTSSFHLHICKICYLFPHRCTSFPEKTGFAVTSSSPPPGLYYKWSVHAKFWTLWSLTQFHSSRFKYSNNVQLQYLLLKLNGVVQCFENSRTNFQGSDALVEKSINKLSFNCFRWPFEIDADLINRA